MALLQNPVTWTGPQQWCLLQGWPLLGRQASACSQPWLMVAAAPLSKFEDGGKEEISGGDLRPSSDEVQGEEVELRVAGAVT